jgi:RimJ/RimL family protein N-acetyltransferase
MKNPFIEGERIYLRNLTEVDVHGNYSEWLNNPDNNRYNSHGRFPHSKTDLLNYIAEIENDRKSLVLAVVEKSNDLHIGNIALQSISWIDRSADISFILGNKNSSGKGYMFEAGVLLINHAFNSLNLHRVTCGTNTENKGMVRLAEKLNFKKEGIRREAIFKQGTYNDIIVFGILKHEWSSNQK